jgi:hypothetical protein
MRKRNSKKNSKLQMNSNTSNQVNLGFMVWCKGFEIWGVQFWEKGHGCLGFKVWCKGVKMWGVEFGKRKRVVQGRTPKHKSSTNVN